ncbi:hypothetical protein [Fluviicola sp.]|uniref:hypothetical protein n=1 Tax=Fluviicola sp. TaxID=1917219 RepID=UPI0031E1B0CA
MKTSVILLLLLLLNSCSEPQLSTYEQIESFYHRFKEGNFERFSRIIVINEEGTCINCNNLFARNQAENLSKDSVLFIVSGYGTMVDISAYVDKSSPNLILDPKNEFQKLNLKKGCSIIEIANHKIKSITTINAKNVRN